MRIFKTLAAAAALLKREELACVTETGQKSLVYRDDTNGILTFGDGNIRYRGAWSSDATYRKCDLVTHAGIGYVAKMDVSAANEPAGTDGYWDALAAS